MTVGRAVARLRATLILPLGLGAGACGSVPIAAYTQSDRGELANCQPSQILHVENLTVYDLEIIQLDYKNVEGIPIAVVGRGTHDIAIQHVDGNRYQALRLNGDPVPRPDRSRIRLTRRCP